MSVLDTLKSAGGGLIESVTIESSLSPAVVLERPLASGGGGPPGEDDGGPLWQRLVRPRVTVSLSTGDRLTFAPGGEPDRLMLPAVAVGIGFILALAIYGAVRLATR